MRIVRGMAVVWSQTIESNHYEVRSAGASLRLYRNGVHHSQWNPNRPLNGSIWDLLILPALHRPEAALESALLLGFGAGTAGRLLTSIAGLERVVGVELDPIHLSIADGFFDCSEGCELVAGDAVEWVHAGGEGEQFDFVLDDLYGEDEGMPVRYAPLDLDWFRRVSDLVAPGGMLVLNTVEPEKVPMLSPLKHRELRARFNYVKVFRMDGYENRIVAFSERPLLESVFVERLRAVGRAYPRCTGLARKYQCEDLRG